MRVSTKALHYKNDVQCSTALQLFFNQGNWSWAGSMGHWLEVFRMKNLLECQAQSYSLFPRLKIVSYLNCHSPGEVSACPCCRGAGSWCVEALIPLGSRRSRIWSPSQSPMTPAWSGRLAPPAGIYFASSGSTA